MGRGLFIPEEIMSDKRLNCADKMVLAYYWYHTTNRNEREFCGTNQCVADYLHMPLRSVERSREHLKTFGLIDTHGLTTKMAAYKNDDTAKMADNTAKMAVFENGNTAKMADKDRQDGGKDRQNDPCNNNNNKLKENKDRTDGGNEVIAPEQTETPRERNRKFDVQLKELQACIAELENIRVMPQGYDRLKAQEAIVKRAKAARDEGKKHATDKQTGLILSQYDKFAKACVALLPYVPRTNND